MRCGRAAVSQRVRTPEVLATGAPETGRNVAEHRTELRADREDYDNNRQRNACRNQPVLDCRYPFLFPEELLDELHNQSSLPL
jgi:hypothetical protein